MKYFIPVLLLLPLFPAVFAVGKVNVLALFRDKAIIEIDGNRHTLAAGQQTESGVRLISANSKEALLEIDGIQQTYTLGVHIGSHYPAAGPGITVTIAPDGQGMYMVNGTINRHPIRFVVDTGATLIMLNHNEAARLGIDYRMTGEETLVNTASGNSKAWRVNLDSVRVGDIELNNIAAVVSNSEFPEIPLLGNSFLNALSIKRDGQLLQLTK